MAFNAGSEWEVRTGGASDNGGGYFDFGGSSADHSQQDAAFATRTDIVIDGSDNTKITSAADAFAADDVGNVINITSGTGFTVQRIQIISEAAGVATCDKAVGTTSSTGGNGKLGGGYDDLDTTIIELMADGNRTHVKNDGTYTTGFTTATDGTAILRKEIIGYNTSRGDIDRDTIHSNKPLLAVGASTTRGDNFWTFKYFRVTTTTDEGVDFDQEAIVESCKVHNFSGSANREALHLLSGTNAKILYNNLQSDLGVAVAAVSGQFYEGNYIHDSDKGILAESDDRMIISRNIFERLSTAAIETTDATYLEISHNTFYKCGIAISSTTGRYHQIYYCIFDSNATGISFSTLSSTNIENWNNFLNQTTADRTNINTGSNSTILAPAFVNPDANFTDLVSDAANPSIVSSVARPFVQGTDEGLVFEITGGTGFTTNFYTIVSIDGSNNATLDQDTGTGTSSGEFTVADDRDFNVGSNMDLTLNTPAPSTITHPNMGAIQRDDTGGGGAGGGMRIVGDGGLAG